ncbi:MAG: peptidoglycan DD-metalloendopeptidase family protein [Prevotellaceae bacterium]|nr:peptidoglycan DD-metalloendopeptidase family protein [Prevotellaceae bacterium]
MKKIAIKSLLTGLLLCVSAGSAFGQDLIARQAPIDRKLKAVDSVAIQRYLRPAASSADAGDALYDSWVTTMAHPYANVEVPDSFAIDLRGFAMPTPSRNVTSNFGYRPRFRRQHKGLDIKVYTGDTIVAAFDGKTRVVRYDAGGYGYYVVLRHPNGLETIYGHLSKQLVSVDDEVKAGQPIGLGGNTGLSYGSHLHFETRFLGEAIDPAEMFDFAAQDVTGDFYMFRKKGGESARTLAQDDGQPEAADTGKATKNKRTRSNHYHKVKKGETLYAIASRLGTTVDRLRTMNGLRPNAKLQIGQILRY